MKPFLRLGLAALAVLVLAAGAYLFGTAAPGEAASAEAGLQEATVPPPDTTGAAIWAHLQASSYVEEWELWPDKGRKYPGQQPHGAQLTTLLNDVAYEALMGDAEEFPDGSIVVKRNFTPGGELAAVTTMYKVAGYNPEHSDWFFTKHLPDGSLDEMPNGMAMEGRLPGCQSCHMSKQENDYIFTGELGG